MTFKDKLTRLEKGVSRYAFGHLRILACVIPLLLSVPVNLVCAVTTTLTSL